MKENRFQMSLPTVGKENLGIVKKIVYEEICKRRIRLLDGKIMLFSPSVGRTNRFTSSGDTVTGKTGFAEPEPNAAAISTKY